MGDDYLGSFCGPASPRYLENAEVTEAKVEPPKQEDVHCRCQSTNKTKVPCRNCACSKWGYPCSSECGCGEACQSPFNDLARIFGTTDPSIKPHPCFVTWLLKQVSIYSLLSLSMACSEFSVLGLFLLPISSAMLIGFRYYVLVVPSIY